MPQPVYDEPLVSSNVQSRLLTKQKCFFQCVRVYIVPLNALQEAFEYCPEETWLTRSEIFHYQVVPQVPAAFPAVLAMSALQAYSVVHLYK